MDAQTTECFQIYDHFLLTNNPNDSPLMQLFDHFVHWRLFEDSSNKHHTSCLPLPMFFIWWNIISTNKLIIDWTFDFAYLVEIHNLCVPLLLSQPHCEGSVRSPLTLPKMGFGSPPGLPKIQNAIARVKTPCIEVLFIPLERSWSLDVRNGLAWAIWTSAAQLMVERKTGSQTGNLTPDH
jgi:hypothetical protein